MINGNTPVIIKRDGSKVYFDKDKIQKAVCAAFEEVEGEITEYAERKAENIANYIFDVAKYSDHQLSIEEIQDMVETGLMNIKDKRIARAYITYRNERTRKRNKNSQFIKTVGEKLTASNVQNQNANVDENSFGGRKGEASNVLMKDYALNYIISEKARENHINNRIYIHDLDNYAVGMHNCLSIPFDKLLAEGFNTRQTDVRPANSVSTAFQLVAVIFQLQSLNQFGGVSATHLDWTMVPYVRKSFKKHFTDGAKYVARVDWALEEYLKQNKELAFDYPGLEANYPKTYQYAMDMTVKEIYQAVEGMYHNLNVWA